MPVLSPTSPPIPAPADLAYLLASHLDVRTVGRFGKGPSEPIQNLTGSLTHGMSRPMDSHIIEVVAQKLANGKLCTLLEIGAGSSLSSTERNYGSPWLARQLAHTYPNQLHVSVSDLISRGSLWVRYPDKNLEWLKGISVAPDLPQSIGERNNINLHRLTESEILALSKTISAENAALLSHAVDDGAQAYIVRHLELGIESCFGISECLAGVDMFNLPASMVERKFDIVMARHVHPGLQTRLKEIFHNFAQVLRTDGMGLVCIESDPDQRRGHELWQVSASGHAVQINASGGLEGMSFSFNNFLRRFTQ